MERIVVAFSNEEAQRRIRRLLEGQGLEVAGCYFTGADAIRSARKLGRAMVVCGFRLRDMTANDLAASLRDVAVLLVVSSPANLSFCEGENLFKLATPAPRSEFYASLDLLRDFEARHLRRPAPKRPEEDRQIIDRAKAILMEVNRMTEGEAHRYLQKRSMDAGMRLTDTARWVVEHYIS